MIFHVHFLDLFEASEINVIFHVQFLNPGQETELSMIFHVHFFIETNEKSTCLHSIIIPFRLVQKVRLI